MKLVNIVGARPQFVKYSAVARAIAAYNDVHNGEIDDVLVHTGQHYDDCLSEVFFGEFGIAAPAYNLGIGSGSHGEQTAAIISGTEAVLTDEHPDAIIVYGDTNTTVGTALAAAKLHIPVAHVEAGLRSFDKRMPEEVNRITTDHLATYLFCPSAEPVKNLSREGFTRIFYHGKLARNTIIDGIAREPAVTVNSPLVVNVGDVMYDVLRTSTIVADESSQILETLGLDEGGYCLMTVHRAGNTDDTDTFAGLMSFAAEAAAGRTVVFPMHPRTRPHIETVTATFGDMVRIIDPVGYLDLVKLMKHSTLVLTDSGGMQKEAFWLSVPCITLRDETEWMETINSGWNVLYRNYTGSHRTKDLDNHPYGDGNAADKIVRVLAAALGAGDSR